MNQPPVRILHVLYELGLGGLETWLVNILRNIDRRAFQFDFLVYTNQPRFYDPEVLALGCRILPCEHPSQGFRHLRDLDRLLNLAGPFDVIHAHGSSNMGNTLRTAARAKIPVRIAHSHTAPQHTTRRLRSWIFRPLTAYWLMEYMTTGLGASEVACASLFGKGWQSDARCRVLYYGFDWQRFKQPVDRTAVRRDLGLPPESLVVGHVGRFELPKNHRFWVEVADQVANQRSDAHFLLVGDGRLRPEVETQIRRLGIDHRFVFTGARGDVETLTQAMDIFLFPSFYEGLPIALLEAQAVGLPCVVSSEISPEATVIEGQVTRIPLAASKGVWARAVLNAAEGKRELNHRSAWEAVAQSRFSLAANMDTLTRIYTGELSVRTG